MTDSDFLSCMAETLKGLMNHVLDMSEKLDTTCLEFEAALRKYEQRKAMEELEKGC